MRENGTLPAEDCKGINRDAVRKAKAQLELELAKDDENFKKGFLRYITNKQNQRDYRPTIKQGR